MKVVHVMVAVGFGICAVGGNVESNDDDLMREFDSAPFIVASPANFTAKPAWTAPTTTLSTEPEMIQPWIGIKTSPKVRRKIEAAFEIAVRRIRDVEACESLFTQLNADGIEMLQTALYFPATAYRETTLCQRAVAATHVGGSPTVICRNITGYSDEDAALVLIHEALHHAGLPESPVNRGSNTSKAINHTVGKRCGH